MASPALETRRATMAVDWLVRVHTPAWLRLAGLTIHADALASLPEITDFAQCPSLMPVLQAARRAVAPDWWVGARDAAGVAAMDAATTAAWTASWAAARAARVAAARDAAGADAMNVAWDTATAASWIGAGAAATDTLKATVIGLEHSALALVECMLSADCGVRPLTAPEPQHRAQWTEMRGQNLRRRAFWCKSAVWAVVFAVIIVAAMLLGPGH